MSTNTVINKEKTISRNQKMLNAWLAAGRVVPTCINDGCGKTIMIRHWNDAGIPSFKGECSRCATARKKGNPIAGVTSHKKTHCENMDGRLGFECVYKTKEQWSIWPSDCFHMDHIDGNHENNMPANVMTLCSLCHTRKGKISGDFNGSRSTSRKVAVPSSSSKTTI